MGHRRQSRECALQLLFQVEFSHQPPLDIVKLFWEENHHSEEVRLFSDELFLGTMRNLKEIDFLIESCSTNWKLSRMASVDRNILRMAAFELIYLEGIPSSVTINEAVEIAKKYGTEESPSFINGILDKIAKEKA